MDPTMTAALKEVLRKTLDNVPEADLKRFKSYLREKDQGRIPWGKLEKADIDDTVNLIVHVYSMEAGGVMLSILQKMDANELAMNLERNLKRFDITAHSGGKVDAPALSGGRPMPQQGGGRDFFSNHKAALETRLGLLAPILSDLEECEVLNAQEREAVESEGPKSKQNRALLLTLEEKGGVAQTEFYRVLLKHDKFLVKDLERAHN